MDRFNAIKVIAPVSAQENVEEWDYFADLQLMKLTGSSVCMTCEHFT